MTYWPIDEDKEGPAEFTDPFGTTWTFDKGHWIKKKQEDEG